MTMLRDIIRAFAGGPSVSLEQLVRLKWLGMRNGVLPEVMHRRILDDHFLIATPQFGQTEKNEAERAIREIARKSNQSVDAVKDGIKNGKLYNLDKSTAEIYQAYIMFHPS
jgi:hypothetical protein